jgi:hypothetical protein
MPATNNTDWALGNYFALHSDWKQQLDVDATGTARVTSSLPGIHVVPAGHYAFLPPCTPQLAANLPRVCTNPSGFDRTAFHRNFDASVVGFFREHLRRHAAEGPSARQLGGSVEASRGLQAAANGRASVVGAHSSANPRLQASAEKDCAGSLAEACSDQQIALSLSGKRYATFPKSEICPLGHARYLTGSVFKIPPGISARARSKHPRRCAA